RLGQDVHARLEVVDRLGIGAGPRGGPLLRRVAPRRRDGHAPAGAALRDDPRRQDGWNERRDARVLRALAARAAEGEHAEREAQDAADPGLTDGAHPAHPTASSYGAGADANRARARAAPAARPRARSGP